MSLPPKHQCLLPPPRCSSCARALRGWLLGILTAGASEGLFLSTVPLTPSEVNFSEPFSVVFRVGKGSCSRKAQRRLQPRLCSHLTASWAPTVSPSLPPSLLTALASQNSSRQKNSSLFKATGWVWRRRAVTHSEIPHRVPRAAAKPSELWATAGMNGRAEQTLPIPLVVLFLVKGRN